MNKVVGARGEKLASEFLQRRGYEILERNFKYDRGEIDLIAKKDDLIVFCEVKTRRSKTYGGGEEAVDSRKQGQIRKVAEGFISSREPGDFDYRFDVIVVEQSGKTTKIRLIENAFY